MISYGLLAAIWTLFIVALPIPITMTITYYYPDPFDQVKQGWIFIACLFAVSALLTCIFFSSLRTYGSRHIVLSSVMTGVSQSDIRDAKRAKRSQMIGAAQDLDSRLERGELEALTITATSD